MIDRALAGDQDAFAEIVETYSGRLMRVAMRVVRNEADAEEIVQDTFLQAFRALSGYRHESALSTWLTRIAFNQAIMSLRRRRASRSSLTVELGAGHQQLAVCRDTPETLCSFDEQQRIVLECMNGVPPALRVPLSMRAIAQMKYSEIAAALELRESTAKVMVHRGRQKLHRVLRARLRVAA